MSAIVDGLWATHYEMATFWMSALQTRIMETGKQAPLAGFFQPGSLFFFVFGRKMTGSSERRMLEVFVKPDAMFRLSSRSKQFW